MHLLLRIYREVAIEVDNNNKNVTDALKDRAITFLICGQFNQYKQRKCRKHGRGPRRPQRECHRFSQQPPAVQCCHLNDY